MALFTDEILGPKYFEHYILQPVLVIVIVGVKRTVLVLVTTWTILALFLVHFVRCVCVTQLCCIFIQENHCQVEIIW